MIFEKQAAPLLRMNIDKRVAVIGMPNVGKSTFFNRVSHGNATIGNWPGMTVDVLQARVEIAGFVTEFVDLPGIYNLQGFSEDEAVVRRFLADASLDLLVVVLNATQLDRQARLLLQIKNLGLPTLTVLNMADEASRYGVKLDPARLAERLDMPVVLLSAKSGQGYLQAYDAIASHLQHSHAHSIPPARLTDGLDLENTPSEAAIQALLAGAVKLPPRPVSGLTARLDRWVLHPILGLPLFFMGMFIIFWVIWSLGLPAQGGIGDLTDGLKVFWLEPAIAALPSLAQDLILNGVWNGAATVASFLPLIFIFFILMAVLEDSGYLSRSAYLMDAFMERLGLDGRSFVLQMLGFGCNVPALMGTRVMQSRPLRLLTMLVIPFSLCSARLQVFVFILAAVFPDRRGAIALFSLYLLSFVVALLTAVLFQGAFKHDEPFVLELPPYRLPTLKQAVRRSWVEVKDFLTRASGLILLGCIAVWMVTHLPPGSTGINSFGGRMGQWLQPVMEPIGMSPELTLALIFGLVAKEVVIGSLAIIIPVGDSSVSQVLAEQLTFAQGYSFCIFCLLYTPCLATLSTLLNESKSRKFTLLSLGFSLGLAWMTSFTFYQVASRFGGV